MLAGADGLAATLQVLPPEASLHADRRALADHLRTVVGARLAGAPAGR